MGLAYVISDSGAACRLIVIGQGSLLPRYDAKLGVYIGASESRRGTEASRD